MGIFKKLKDVLFDVEEEEIPVISKEEHKVEPKKEEQNPIKEIKMPKEDVPVREEIKKDSSFNFPLDFDEPRTRSKKNYDFDDDDFNVRKPLTEVPKKKEEDPNPKKRDYLDYSKFLHEEPKKETPVAPFKPTPIISPVYGILDQNYTKDDVIVKTDIGVKGPDLDEVRKKAYGIDNKKKETPKKEEPTKKSEKDDEFTEPIRTLDEILMEKDNPKEEVHEETPVRKTKTIDLEATEQVEYLEADEKIEDDELPDEPYADEIPEKKEETKKDNQDDTLESDLFNLIDSMYDDKKERDDEE